MTPDVDAPPFCDLVWLRAGPAEFMALRTPLYDAAVECAHQGMRTVGFDLGRTNVHLDLTACQDLRGLAKRLAIWTGAAGKRLAFEQARDAALRPPAAEAVAALQAGLAEMMSTAAWAFGGRIDLADRFSREATLTRRQAEWASDILAGARAAVAAADARLATEAGAEALERAYDEGVRADLLAACRELSALDGDRCREANGRGWGAIASAPGHRLAGMTAFTPLQAAHAIALVHPHRRQLSPDLRERLFGAVPAPGPRHP
jgi:hypothetical protein